MALQIEKQVIGTDRSYPLRIKNARGEPVTSYKIDNPLTAKVWRGDNLPTIATPALTWRNPGLGTVTLTIDPDDFATPPEPGRYEVMCFVGEAGGKIRAFAHFAIQFVASPAAGSAGKVYGTLDEMAVYYAPVVKFAAETDQANAAEQRAAARRWLDTWIEDHPGTLSRAEVRARLAADELVVTGKVAEIVAKKAIAIVLGNQVTQDPAAVSAGRKSAFEPDRQRFDAEAQALAATLVAELDDGSGTATPVDARDPVIVAAAAAVSKTLGWGILRAGGWRARNTEI